MALPSSHLQRILQCSQGASDDDGTFDDEGCRGIVTGPVAGQDTLVVASIKSHIADKDALERLESTIGTPLPEMVFEDNTVLVHQPRSGFTFALLAVDALRECMSAQAETARVASAAPVSPSITPVAVPVIHGVRAWTFTTPYAGTVWRGSGDAPAHITPEDTEERIDLQQLRRPDPILWSDAVTLFEDELGDNGTAQYTVKVRVMPGSVFLLARFMLRVDGVLVRLRDVRVWARRGHSYLLRETTVREATFEHFAASGLPTDPAAYTKPEEFAHNLPVVSQVTHRLPYIAASNSTAPGPSCSGSGAGSASGASLATGPPASSTSAGVPGSRDGCGDGGGPGSSDNAGAGASSDPSSGAGAGACDGVGSSAGATDSVLPLVDPGEPGRAARVVLRPVAAGDEDALVAAANDRGVWMNLRNVFPHPYTQEDARFWVQFCTSQRLPQQHIAIEVDGRYAGGIAAMGQTDVHSHVAELGYWLGREFWGRGVATRAVRLFIPYAFDTLGYKRLEACVYARNHASAHVLEKCGFQREGVMRASAVKDGEVLDQILFSLLDSDPRP